MTTPKRDIVLIHGSWCGGWIWRDLRALLEAEGHRVFAPSLTGLADRSHLLGPEVNLTTHVLDIANLIRWEGLRDAVLVGHSYGGMVISGVADMVDPGTIGAIVYLDALYLQDGERVGAVKEGPHAPRLIEVDGVRCLAPAEAGAAFGLLPAEAARINALFTPMPAAAFAEKRPLRGARDRIARKTFVLAERCTMPFFRPIAEALAAHPDWTIERMDTDHLMMVEDPAATAGAILRAAVFP